MNTLDKIFNPKTIAVIGASDEPGKVGYDLFRNLINSDYKGTVYPINIKRGQVQNIKAYPSLKELSDKVDLAVIATPASTVPGIIEECGQMGVGGAAIISAGFAETGKEGEALAENIKNISQKYQIKILGPNCLGFIVPKLHLNASFANKNALPGKIAFISQSGALCTAMLDWSVQHKVGFSYFVSIGSMIDLGFHDLIEYISHDPETTSILLYMESLTEAQKFLSIARTVSLTKPIFVIKSGRSNEGTKAAKSHTGGLAGNDAVFDAAFEQAGIVRVDTIADLFNSAEALAMQPLPVNNRIAVVTNAGGPGVIATDSLINHHQHIGLLSEKTIAELDKLLPPAWSHGNPVDVLGDASPERYKQAVELCIKDDNIDIVLAILTPQSMTNPTTVAESLCATQHNGRVDGWLNAPGTVGKSLLAAWMGGDDVAEGRKVLEAGDIPVYASPEDAISCIRNLTAYRQRQRMLSDNSISLPHSFTPDTTSNRELLSRIISEQRTVLTEAESKKILLNYEIPILKNATVVTAREAGDFAAQIGFPVAMKILSPDIIHKTDIGGVKLNINSQDEAKAVFNEIITGARRQLPHADIHGVFIEAMVKKRYELLIGGRKDAIFGPAIVFGRGGVAVEIFKDFAIGLPPLSMSQAKRLIEKTKIHDQLIGYRGMPAVDIQSIQFILYKFAQLILDFPEINEIDINPFAVDEYGGVVLDAKVILDEQYINEGKKR